MNHGFEQGDIKKRNKIKVVIDFPKIQKKKPKKKKIMNKKSENIHLS